MFGIIPIGWWIKRLVTFGGLLSLVWWGGAWNYAFADDTELSRNTLKGISVLEVVVEGLGSDIDGSGTLRSQMKIDAETRLRYAGLNVSNITEVLPTSAWLRLHAKVIRSGQFGYTYYVDLRLVQPVRLVRDSSFYLATTWSKDIMGYAGSLENIRDTANDHVFAFISAYRSANPITR